MFLFTKKIIIKRKVQASNPSLLVLSSWKIRTPKNGILASRFTITMFPSKYMVFLCFWSGDFLFKLNTFFCMPLSPFRHNWIFNQILESFLENHLAAGIGAGLKWPVACLRKECLAGLGQGMLIIRCKYFCLTLILCLGGQQLHSWKGREISEWNNIEFRMLDWIAKNLLKTLIHFSSMFFVANVRKSPFCYFSSPWCFFF